MQGTAEKEPGPDIRLSLIHIYFLIDTHVLSKIITAAGVTKDDMVLEIGPGIRCV